MGYKNPLSQRQNFALALAGSTLLHAWLLAHGSHPSEIPLKRNEGASFSAQIKPPAIEASANPETAITPEAPNNSPSANPSLTPANTNADSIQPDSEPSEIVFDRPPVNPGMRSPIGWGGMRYQNEEQIRARTVSDFMQKLQPLVYQINPERCVLQTSADARTASLHCNTVKDQQQLMSGIGPFLNFTDQIPTLGACFTLIGTQITVTKKCAPF